MKIHPAFALAVIHVEQLHDPTCAVLYVSGVWPVVHA
jgi:hypothetical protein